MDRRPKVSVEHERSESRDRERIARLVFGGIADAWKSLVSLSSCLPLRHLHSPFECHLGVPHSGLPQVPRASSSDSNEYPSGRAEIRESGRYFV
jgi:hypothetical protein